MHEVGLVSAAIAQAIEVARRAGATRVACLSFVTAAGGHVTPDSVTMLVAVLGRGTPVEGARVEVEVGRPEGGTAELALASIDVEVPAQSQPRRSRQRRKVAVEQP